MSDGDDAKPSVTRVVTLGGLVVGFVAGALGLLFTLQPNLKPCIGGIDASFTGTPVFPHVGYRDYLFRTGEPSEGEPNIRGAEVRFSYRVDSARGHELPVRFSLLQVERDGTVGAVVHDEDRALAMTIKPDGCSETGGKDLFVQIPAPRRRYRVVLELYRDEGLTDRLALAQTQVFRG
jgi:hypothetical protein